MSKNVHRLFNREKEYDILISDNKVTIFQKNKFKAQLDFDHTSYSVSLSSDGSSLTLQPLGNSLRF